MIAHEGHNAVPSQAEAAGRPADAAPRAGNTILRLVVGGQLRQHRIAAGLTTEHAAFAIRGSHSKISRMESGRTGFKNQDIKDLLTVYGVTDESADVPDVVYLEQFNSALDVDDPVEVVGYLAQMDQLVKLAAQPNDSIRILNELLKDLRREL